MRTVQMTLDEKLLDRLDAVVRRRRTNRSAFTRLALQAALARLQTEELEQKHRRGYEALPVAEREFGVAEEDQRWGDA